MENKKPEQQTFHKLAPPDVSGWIEDAMVEKPEEVVEELAYTNIRIKKAHIDYAQDLADQLGVYRQDVIRMVIEAGLAIVSAEYTDWLKRQKRSAT